MSTPEQFREECFVLLDRAEACLKLYQVMCDDLHAPIADLITDLAHLQQEAMVQEDSLTSGSDALRIATDYYRDEQAGVGIVGMEGPFDYTAREKKIRV